MSFQKVEDEHGKSKHVLTFDSDSISVEGKSIPVLNSDEDTDIVTMETKANAEGIQDGIAFYDSVFVDDLVNIIVQEEKEINPGSRVFKMNAIHSVIFEMLPREAEDFFPKFIVRVKGKFED